jgi:hypothetical protein
MAHFAELDENNTVIRVIVVHNNELIDNEGNESEQKGIDFCTNLFDGIWIQTSYNGNFRKNFAGLEYQYDNNLDAFIPKKCHNDAELNFETCRWECENNDHKVLVI